MKISGRKGNGGACRTLLFGVLTSIITLAAMAALCAVILLRLPDPSAIIGPCACGAFMVSGGVSGILISKKNGKGGVRTSLLTILLFLLLLLLIGLIWTKGELPPITLLNLCCYGVIAAIFTVMGTKEKRRRTRRMHRR